MLYVMSFTLTHFYYVCVTYYSAYIDIDIIMCVLTAPPSGFCLYLWRYIRVLIISIIIPGLIRFWIILVEKSYTFTNVLK